MNRILVTGGLGYIGSHTCVELINSNNKITIIDSLINSKIESLQKIKKIVKLGGGDNLHNIEFIKGDLRDYKFLDELFYSRLIKQQKFDAVIHFCGLKSVHESIIKPIEYWDVNVSGSLNLLKVMKKYNCLNLVFSSSATVYGNPDKFPIDENDEIKPINTYGQTKAIVEKLLFNLYYESSKRFKIAILRYFNPVGAHPSGLLGENPVGKPHNIFPILNSVAITKKGVFRIYGNDWPTYDGTCIRDYIHVLDIADGHLKALNFLLNNDSQIITFNLGSGLGTSVLDLVNTFKKVNNLNFPIIFENRRKGDVPKLIANNNFAKQKLDWEPKRNIESMCKDSWNFFKKNTFAN